MQVLDFFLGEERASGDLSDHGDVGSGGSGGARLLVEQPVQRARARYARVP
ncbi:hypothetical protein [Streptomyces sp. CB00072]|uniref:hypothetical protein n=1 Tax=Streptomyces sp. CB00072 TaxID=1703928 RepID=UPI0013010ED0|nr:hypothetical protein [Streptomyces sp. CB00072]